MNAEVWADAPGRVSPEQAAKVSPEQAAQIVAEYSPRMLPADHWKLARPAVTDAMRAVAEAGVGTKLHPLLSVLIRFLADGGWDRLDTPDWQVLLTEPNIEKVCAGWARRMPPATVTQYRGCLRRVARAVGTAPPGAPRCAPHARPGAGWWRARRWCGPFPALAAASSTTGSTLNAVSLLGVGPGIAAEGALTLTAPPHGRSAVGRGGTVTGGKGAPEHLRSAPDIGWEAAMTHTPPRPVTRPRRRARTGTARMAELRREARAAKLPPRVAEPPVLPADVTAKISSYRPLKVSAAEWARVADAARAGMAAFEPASPRWVSTHGGIVVRFALWVAVAVELPADGRLDPAALLTPGLVDRYVAGSVFGSDATVGTARWVLRRTVTRLNAAADPVTIAHQPVQPPYSPAECAQLVSLARHQPTDARRREMSAAVALGLGAGLGSADQRHVTRADIVDVDVDGAEALAVQVRGRHPRLVVVRHTYTALLAEAVALHEAAGLPADAPLYGRSPNRQRVVSAVASRAVTATGSGVDLSAARMRTTWLLAVMCTPLPLAALLAAAGLTGARALVELLPYCPDPDPDQVAAVLAGVDDSAPAGPR